jgi:hypothetical protein
MVIPFRPALLAASAAAALALTLAAPRAFSQAADSLPAFRTDSAAADPFKKAEAGPSPWSAQPAAAPKGRHDSGAAADTVTDRLRKRRPAVSVYLGVDFLDFDAKDAFKAALTARTLKDSLKTLQDFEPVHLAFPIGIQAAIPVSGYLDVVAKTHSYWYKQSAVLGDKNSRHAGDEWYAVQGNLAGLGLRVYVPPSFLSVTGGLGLYAQGVLYWNVGGTEIYTPYGRAQADFDPAGSGYELVFGMQHALTGPWQLNGSLGFLQQTFTSQDPWSNIIVRATPAGDAHWGSSAIQAALSLWYHFGVPAQAATPANSTGSATGNTVPAASAPNGSAGALPLAPAPTPAPADSAAGGHF